ncbi:MAG: hypothetical protein PHS15_06320 [Clostridiaceae bacterium]|nr:hypothetical protein [Clostridiaceae bacterium]
MYPKMQIPDMVKLIYQNEFAGGHLISNEDDCLKRLTEEIQGLGKYSQNATFPAAFEEIGNGLCRLHLAAVQSADVDITTINRFFISTANSFIGSIQSFEEKLEVFKQCCKDKSLPYQLGEVEAYLNDYQRQGYPPVSHSKNYRTLYSPAYRIVKAEYKYYFEIFRRIDSLRKSHESIQIAIDGNSGAGKSTLAALLGSVYDCNIFHMDHFFLRPELKTKERLKEIGGNVDYIRFRQEVVAGLQRGREFKYQIYNCKKMTMDQYISVLPKKLNIIEGVYSMHPTLIGNYNLKIFLRIDEKEQSLRILKRNGDTMQKQFLCKWIPLENQYFKQMKIEEKSDLVFLG